MKFRTPPVLRAGLRGDQRSTLDATAPETDAPAVDVPSRASRATLRWEQVGYAAHPSPARSLEGPSSRAPAPHGPAARDSADCICYLNGLGSRRLGSCDVH